jgi:site-specific DNA recombinase
MTAPRVVSYIRMSDDKQESSPERQREGIAKYAGSRGYAVAREYSDLGISGWRDDRPGFRQLLADAATGKFDVILVDEPSRLSRSDPFAFIALVAFPLQKAKVAVEAVSSGPMSWDDLAGIILTVVSADRSSTEVKSMSRRVLAGMVREARAGSWHGPAPFGYRKVKGDDGVVRLVPGDPLHVEAVKFMFKEYAAGRRGLAGVAAELAARGVVSNKRRGDRRGTAFTPQGVASILRNPVYVGDFTWNKVTAGKFSRLVDGKAQLQPDVKRGRNPEGEWIVIADSHPALIDRDTFAAVRERLKTNRRRTTPMPDGGTFKLSRLLVCGACGAFMCGFTDNRAGCKRYKCGSYYQGGRAACTSNTVKEDTLVALVADKIQAFLTNPDVFARVREETRRQEAEMRDPETARALTRQLADLDAKIKRGNARLLELPDDLVPGVTDALQKLKSERARVKSELDRIDRQTRPSEELERAVDDITRRVWRLRNVMLNGEPADVRAAVESLVDRVVLDFDRRETGKTVRTKLRGGRIVTSLALSNLSCVAGST